MKLLNVLILVAGIFSLAAAQASCSGSQPFSISSSATFSINAQPDSYIYTASIVSTNNDAYSVSARCTLFGGGGTMDYSHPGVCTDSQNAHCSVVSQTCTNDNPTLPQAFCCADGSMQITITNRNSFFNANMKLNFSAPGSTCDFTSSSLTFGSPVPPPPPPPPPPTPCPGNGNCNSHGICNVGGTCTCNSGYSGYDCSQSTPNPPNPPHPPTPPAPGPAGIWAGSYTVGSQCDVTSCCCMTAGSVLVLTQTGSVVSFDAPLYTTNPAARLGGCTGTLPVHMSLSSPTSTTSAGTVLGQPITVTLSGAGGVITWTNGNNQQCSFSAPSLYGPPAFPIGAVAGGAGAGALIVIAIVVLVILIIRRRNRMLQELQKSDAGVAFISMNDREKPRV